MSEIQNRHGSYEECLEIAPRIGRRYETGEISIELNPATPYEVHFSSDQDVLSIMAGSLRGERAYDSDRIAPLNLNGYLINYHPAGSVT